MSYQCRWCVYEALSGANMPCSGCEGWRYGPGETPPGFVRAGPEQKAAQEEIWHSTLDVIKPCAQPTAGDMKQSKQEAKVRPFQAAMTAVHEVMLFGATKYAPGNERNAKPEDMPAYDDALFRHWQARRLGQATDPDSGLLHLAHMAWNVLFMLEQELRGITNSAWRTDVAPTLAAFEAKRGTK